jgi:hypothetical protein
VISCFVVCKSFGVFNQHNVGVGAGILVIQGGQLDEDEEEGIYYFAKMVHDLRTIFPYVTYYTKYVRSFDGFWGFMVACKVERCGDSPVVNPDAAPSLVDRLIAERIEPNHKFVHFLFLPCLFWSYHSNNRLSIFQVAFI